PRTTGAASVIHALVAITRRTITKANGTASTTIVNGRASNPHPSATATQRRSARRPESSQRIVAHTAISHIAVLVVSEKYDADQNKVAQAVVHNHQVRSAIHSFARRLASQN